MHDPAVHDLSGWSAAAVTAAVQALTPLADPQRATPMAAYMRDQFSFLGIGTPARTAALKIAWRGLPAPSGTDLAGAARALWVLPHREFQYAGCDLLGRWHRLLPADLLTGTIESLITTKSWWDTVDSLRKAAVGPLVAAHPELVGVLRRWIDADDPWLARSAIIHQLGYGPRTDADLLFAFCARRAADREFFVAKAIGWALRTHARLAPDDVRSFVAAHPELSPLARREALKHLEPLERR
ncbi:MAG TPA: DNA alkylation repair protein [Kineosporiaceae bacterium]|nr:DNA alkylation repair protein [Kineosporiaceae bacterium]